MTERRVLGALAAVAALVVVALVVLAATDPGPPATLPAPRVAPPPRPPPVQTARPGTRSSLPRPRVRPSAKVARLEPNTKYHLNDAVDIVVQEARAACLDPWFGSLPVGPTETEVVLDVVTVDGVVADFGARSLGAEALSDEALSCLADIVWAEDWPTFDGLPGETRLQRPLDLKRDPP